MAAAAGGRDAYERALGLIVGLEVSVDSDPSWAFAEVRAIARAALVSSGSGGPGVHLTADEAEQIAFVLEGRSHSLNCGIWVSGEPCTCGREAALVLLRPAVRGGGQADTEGEL